MNRPDDRYVKLETKRLPDGRVVYRSCRPRAVETNEADASFEASSTDRMDVVAHNVYGSAMDWWRIAAANKRVDGSLFLKLGTTVIIPKG